MQIIEFISKAKLEEISMNSSDFLVKELWKAEKAEWEKNEMTLGVFPELQCNYVTINGIEFPDNADLIYYPWKNAVVISFGKRIYNRLVTVRNQRKITVDEQERLFASTIAVVGLSVGFQVVKSLVMSNLCGRIRIADFDEIELTNLNRLDCGVFNVGMSKIEMAYRWIKEQNPYVEVDIFSDGVNSTNYSDFLTLGHTSVNLLVDECDSLKVKIDLRKIAKSLRIPVVMHTSDRGMLDVENFGVDDKEFKYSFLKYSSLSESEIQINAPKIVADICDLKNASERSKESFLLIGTGLKSWPQLAEDVVSGGGNVATVARLILLDRKIKSQRLLLSPELMLEELLHGDC